MKAETQDSAGGHPGESGRDAATDRQTAGRAAAGRAPGGGRPLALIKGAGDLATGVALRLTSIGYSVVMTETALPTAVRRTVAFADAVYRGRTEVQGLEGVLVEDEGQVSAVLATGAVVVVVDPVAEIRARLRPDLVVDAIMAKRNLGTRLTDAPAVVALGPGFVAGRDVHAVVETMRGRGLGRVILEGGALPDTGVPAERNGFGKERVLRSPRAGVFTPLAQIGDRVRKGDVIGYVDGSAVVSRLDGIVRGMLHEGLEVVAEFKLGDVDPIAAIEECYLVSDKALAIGDGVIEASRRLLRYPAPTGW